MKLAIFDFDGTILPKDTLPFLLSQWYHNNYSKTKLMKVYLPLIPLYLIYKFGVSSRLTKEEMRIKALHGFNSIFVGMTEKEIVEYFSKTCQSMKKLLNESVVQEIRKANDSGFHTVILSGSYSILLEMLGKYLGINTIIGTEMYFKDGIFDHDKGLDLISGSSKVKRLCGYFDNQQIDWTNSYAYADSYTDLELLELVGNPIIVNPDERLKSVALEKKWRLIS